MCCIDSRYQETCVHPLREYGISKKHDTTLLHHDTKFTEIIRQEMLSVLLRPHKNVSTLEDKKYSIVQQKRCIKRFVYSQGNSYIHDLSKHVFCKRRHTPSSRVAYEDLNHIASKTQIFFYLDVSLQKHVQCLFYHALYSSTQLNICVHLPLIHKHLSLMLQEGLMKLWDIAYHRITPTSQECMTKFKGPIVTSSYRVIEVFSTSFYTVHGLILKYIILEPTFPVSQTVPIHPRTLFLNQMVFFNQALPVNQTLLVACQIQPSAMYDQAFPAFFSIHLVCLNVYISKDKPSSFSLSFAHPKKAHTPQSLPSQPTDVVTPSESQSSVSNRSIFKTYQVKQRHIRVKMYIRIYTYMPMLVVDSFFGHMVS